MKFCHVVLPCAVFDDRILLIAFQPQFSKALHPSGGSTTGCFHGGNKILSWLYADERLPTDGNSRLHSVTLLDCLVGYTHMSVALSGII